jgi:membrane protease YdiL (CAAX protease family)
MMRSIVLFFSLTYIVSWIVFTAVAPRSPLFLLGVFAPSLVALALTAQAEGRAGALALIRRIGRWPTDPRWYVFAVGYLVAIKLIAALLHRLITGAWPIFGATPVYLMAAAVIVSTPVQAGEEIGWRGYALPRLASHFGLPAASIVVGVVWAFWHTPLFFIPGADTLGQSLPVYVLTVTALSVAMAWLYWRTNESVLLTMLMHAAVNNTKDIVPSATPDRTDPFTMNASLIAWLTAGLLWICAVYFLTRMRRAILQQHDQAASNEGRQQ